MKAFLLSAALLAPVIAMANDDKATTEKKADDKGKAATDKDKNKDQYGANDKDKAVNTDLSQSQLLDTLHKVAVGHTEMGNLAQTHAKSDKVKRFGEKMTKDFAGVDQQVIGYAKDHDIVLSDATGLFKGALGKVESKIGSKAEKYSGLGKLQGEDFDKKFLTATVEGCQKLIPVLEGAKGKFDDKKFDGVLGKAIDTLKAYQKDGDRLQKDEAPAS